MRATTILSGIEDDEDYDQPNSSEYVMGHNMLELIYFHFNRLSMHTFVDYSKMVPHKSFKNDTVGRGLFSSTTMRKGHVLYATLETGVTARIVDSGGTDNFHLGCGQALAPMNEDESKDAIFMINHADEKSCNVRVEVGYSEFETSVKTMVYVIRVEVKI